MAEIRGGETVYHKRYFLTANTATKCILDIPETAGGCSWIQFHPETGSYINMTYNADASPSAGFYVSGGQSTVIYPVMLSTFSAWAEANGSMSVTYGAVKQTTYRQFL